MIFEKPFGRDLASARQLNRDIRKVLEENQIYRIDHYLGKETVQNIMVFRFANGIFEPVWNRRYIDHVQITVAEDLGVEERGGYYEQSGALRDMVPNHIFQLISLTAMEPPISFDADAVRDEQAKVLRAIQPMSPEEVLRRTVRGQYGAGTIDGEAVPGYRDGAQGRRPNRRTETFVAMKLYIDNWRWADVPFYLRTGKRQPKRVTEIGIQFKRAPFILFRQTAIQQLTPNRLTLRIQPDEGISLTFGAKVPGPVLQDGHRRHGFQIRRLLRQQAQHRLRAPALRLHVGRRHAVPARRHDRSQLGGGRARFSMSGKPCRRATSPTTRQEPGDRKPPTTCWNAKEGPGRSAVRAAAKSP